MGFRKATSLFLLLALVSTLAGIGIPPTDNALAANISSTPQNPEFRIERGTLEGQLKAIFPSVTGVDRFVIRVYDQRSNFEVGHAYMVTSNVDFGHAGSFSDSICSTTPLCRQMRDGQGLKFTIQGHSLVQDPYSLTPVNEESPKSIVHYPFGVGQPQLTWTVPIDTEQSVMRTTFTPYSGISSLSLRLYTAIDNYANHVQELTGIAPGTSDQQVEGGNIYKLRYRAVGTRTNNAVYLDSGWSPMSLNNYQVHKRPNAPNNVRVTVGDRTIAATWDAPTPVAGVSVNSFQVGLSTDRITWINTNRNVNTFDYTTNTLNRLANGTPYWMRIRSIGSFGVIRTWNSTVQYTPAFTPVPPQFTASIEKTNKERVPVPCGIASAGMIFFPGIALHQCPFDPYLNFLFFGEELL
jgi:hypothetical protein